MGVRFDYAWRIISTAGSRTPAPGANRCAVLAGSAHESLSRTTPTIEAVTTRAVAGRRSGAVNRPKRIYNYDPFSRSYIPVIYRSCPIILSMRTAAPPLLATFRSRHQGELLARLLPNPGREYTIAELARRPGRAIMLTWLHCLGFRGHITTKTRRYSTTLQALRARRFRWQMMRNHMPAELDQPAHIKADDGEPVLWEFRGCGHATTGERLLVLTAALSARQRRQAARDALTDTPPLEASP